MLLLGLFFTGPTQCAVFHALQHSALDKALRDKYSLSWCCTNTMVLWSPTLPQLTRPGSDGDDTSLPHTTPSLVYDFHRWLHNHQDQVRYWTPTHISSHRDSTHITQPPSLLSLSLCVKNTAHNNTELFPGFLLPDLHLTLSEPHDTVCLGYLSQLLWKSHIMWVSKNLASEQEPGRKKKPELLYRNEYAAPAEKLVCYKQLIFCGNLTLNSMWL